jgi:hypothetical protein
MARSRAEQNEIELVRRLYQAVVATINETPQGAPGGPMYAAVMQYMNLDQFTQMMDSLVHAKRIRREGDVYYPIGQ